MAKEMVITMSEAEVLRAIDKSYDLHISPGLELLATRMVAPPIVADEHGALREPHPNEMPPLSYVIGKIVVEKKWPEGKWELRRDET